MGDLPTQGSTEAIGWLAEDALVVLYPDDQAWRVYGTDGEVEGTVTLAEDVGLVHGAIAVPSDRNRLLLMAGDPAELLEVDPDDGNIVERTQLTGAAVSWPAEGLSLGVDGGDARLLMVDGEAVAYAVDRASGEIERLGTVSEVGEPSGIEGLVNPEGEEVFAISDDDDAYNAEPGPVRLYLAP